MHISDLSLHDFRSYDELVIELGPGPTAFIGPNGQGKTNIVEAVAYLGTLTSHRVANDAPLVRSGAEAAVVRAKAVREERANLLELEIVAGRANRARLNRAPLPRARDILGMVPSVLFAPEDLTLIKGDPQARRRFLDDLVVQLTPRLAGVRAEYDKVLRQRSALLKSAGAARRRGAKAELATLDVWDGHLAASGAQLIAARAELLHLLRPHVASDYAAISEASNSAHLRYRSSLHNSSELSEDDEAELRDVNHVHEGLLQAMGEQRQKEIERGISLVGPHRDDLVLYLDDLPARGYASHGEAWSYALALRLASYHLLVAEQDTWQLAGKPVLILDDVFAELDVRRRQALVEMVRHADQLLITAAVAADVPGELNARRLLVADGQVRDE